MFGVWENDDDDHDEFDDGVPECVPCDPEPKLLFNNVTENFYGPVRRSEVSRVMKTVLNSNSAPYAGKIGWKYKDGK